MAIGTLATTPIAIVRTPATSAVAAAAAGMNACASGEPGAEHVRQDGRVQEQDVGHDHERGQAGLRLRPRFVPRSANLK